MIIYEGPSKLDGSPIVVIATAGSKNAKTGDMIQTWILRADVAPHVAQRTGDDASVCGDCPQRPGAGGGCYVTTFQAPLAVWRAYRAGSTSGAARVARAIRAGVPVRIGSYGDPAAVPVAVWQRLLYVSRRYGATSHTGYTHQWRTQIAQPLRWLLMASIDNAADIEAARRMGWRTFSIATERPAGSIECLSDAKGLSCADCGVCDGARRRDTTAKQPASVYILPHGARGKRAAALAVLQ